MAEHPDYPGSGYARSLILIGDTAHSAVTGQTGTVIAIRQDEVTIQNDSGQYVVGSLYLRYGPAPEPEPPLLAIRPTWDQLRSLVRMVDSYGDHGGRGRVFIGADVVDAIPADIAARLRAENKAAGR